MKKLWKYFRFIITFAVLLFFVVYIYRNPELITSLRDINAWYIVGASILFLVVFFLEGLFIKITLHAFDKDITVKESFYLSTLSRIGNYLLPMRAGAIFRAAYLKKKYNFEYSKFLSTLYGYYIILFLLYSVLGGTVLLVKWLVGGQQYTVLILFFIGLFLGMFFLMFVRLPFDKLAKNKESLLGKIVGFLERFMSSWDRIIKNKKLLLQLLLVTFGNILFNTVIILVEFVALGIRTNILDLILYSCLSGVSLLVSITPGSLGIREAVFIISSQSLGLSQEQILQLAIVDRGILFVLLFIMMIFTIIFLKEFNIKDVFFAKKEN
jgi:uncharacterized protein (TIRG00374 family)